MDLSGGQTEDAPGGGEVRLQHRAPRLLLHLITHPLSPGEPGGDAWSLAPKSEEGVMQPGSGGKKATRRSRGAADGGGNEQACVGLRAT